jgi:AcrR family transcriptional regulator
MKAERLSEAAATGTLLPARPVRASRSSMAALPVGATRLDQIRRVGCRLLFQHGYSGMTMRQIAAGLRIKAASLYYHFPSKQEILFDLMSATATELLEGLREIAASDQAPAAKLEAAIRWHVLFHTQKREEAFVSHSELRSLAPANLKAVLRLRQQYDSLFDSILRQVQEQSPFPVEETGVLRNCILTMCTATAGWFSPDGPLSAEQIADRVWAFVRAGLLLQDVRS